jgi:hypothetical protein
MGEYTIRIYNPENHYDGFNITQEADTVEDAINRFFDKVKNCDEVHNYELLLYHVMLKYFKAGRYSSNELNIYFTIDRADLRMWDIIQLAHGEKKEKKMNKYEFIVVQKGTVKFLATWDCYAEDRHDAIERFIRVLKDPNLTDDEYEEDLYRAIVKKLVRQEYETFDRYTVVQFTLEELDNM